MESNYLLELDYNIYLAEQEFYSNLITFRSKAINESCGLITLNEDFRENIRNYITKIVTAIQGAWNKFMNKIIQSPNKKYLESIGKQVATWEGEVEVKNFPNLNNDNFRNLQLVNYNPDEINNFKTKDDIIQAKFSNIQRNEGESFKTACYNFMNANKVNGIMNGNDIRLVYNIAYKGINSASKILENNITEFNNTIKAIQSNISENNNNYFDKDISKNDMSILVESYLMEADDKVEINTGVDGTTSGVNLARNINNLIAINTDILSSKMKYLRTQYMWCIKLLKSLFKADKNDQSNEQQPENDQVAIDIQSRKTIEKNQ